MGKCNHKDKNGESLINELDNVCPKCGMEFGTEFFKKQRDRRKRNKKKSNDKELN